MKKIYRQGDVLLTQVESIPTDSKKANTLIIAEGEATGHHHRFIGENVSVYKNNGKLYADIAIPTPLIHEEHKKIIIDPGLYEISSEREYDYTDEELKKVID